MNKTEQAQQLRLAAELIETGHPFAFQDGGEWVRAITITPDHAICERREIRPILATPPDGRPLHNPDNLTVEQVGLGYRLARIDEKTNENEALQEFWNKGEWMTSGRVYSDTFGEAPNHRITYRLPLTVPWPEVKADPYAELKAAKKAGKAIEAQMPNGEWFDYKPDEPQWNLQPECYRIKPEPPAFQLPPPPISWRYAETTKTVEIGPEDVPPGTVLRGAGEVCSQGWCAITSCSETGIRIWRQSESSGHEITWGRLRESASQINRSIPLTGKWDANAWEPCSKEVQA